ncbi:hypothetical protein ABDX87_19835 [Pseudomonas abietaniphila]|uniref:hypothetical protein n=1 Tax=Pseudomonas abietaniphila TaxID=89065 RepID=UPI003216F7E1
MPVTYSDFCTDALELLHALPTTESRLRNSVSRAYYGVYHGALAYADKVNVPPVSDRAGPSHEKLRAFYQDDMSLDMDVRMKRKRVGYMLKVLVGNRRKADYDLGKTITHIDADAHYQRCMQCVQVVQELEALVKAA